MPILSDVAKKAMALLLAVSLVGAVLLGGWVLSLRTENKRLGGAVAGLTADLELERHMRAVDQQVAKDYAKKVATLTTKRIADESKLSRALTASHEWAAMPVPADVADALGMPDADAPSASR